MDLYAENILEHYRNPRGKLPVLSPTVSHTEENLSCGDAVTVQLVIRDGKIESVGWDGTGCAISQAAMSMLAEELPGMTVEAAESLTPQHIHDLLGVPIGPRRLKCALLALHALKNALRIAKGEKVEGWLSVLSPED